MVTCTKYTTIGTLDRYLIWSLCYVGHLLLFHEVLLYYSCVDATYSIPTVKIEQLNCASTCQSFKAVTKS